MPNKVRRNSVVDLLAKVPVNRGSLLKSIENLLKTIESSESAVMIPTLLRDKCEFDAWELLFVAKILKASILGHSDLVEFYMNHIGHSSAQFSNNEQQQQQQTALSPSLGRQSSPNLSTIMMENGNGTSNGVSNSNSNPNPQTPTTPTTPVANNLPTSPSLSSSTSSVSSVSTTTQTSTNGQTACKSQTSSNSWVTANQHIQSSSSNSISSSLNGSVLNDTASSSGYIGSSLSNQTDSSSLTSREIDFITNESLLAAKPLLMRQAQPPSLLQLTTTNNHINSVAAVAAGFTNNNIEQLTHQLSIMQTNGCLSSNNGSSPNGSPHGALSISTTAANQHSPANSGGNGNHSNGGNVNGGTTTPTPNGHSHPELRSSRSAGCLFRINSGASSPRTPIQTPTTPYPQAETLANGQTNGISGDPSTPVKLLLQIEQLKSSINHVTNLLESVVELYKKSIDNIA